VRRITPIAITVKTSGSPIAERIAALDWPDIEKALELHGCATLRALLTPRESSELAGC
jgi:hypothetical protein